MPGSQLNTLIARHRTIIQTAALAALIFCTYSCMYAFRKPFSVAYFDGLRLWGIDLKIWYISAQIVGYTLSKFYGIKAISEMKPNERVMSLYICISVSWFALLGFALTQQPYNIVWMLLNGFPLGLIWGVVFSYAEGRRSTEVLLAVLCTSFIFSSGLVKRIGKALMLDYHVDESWMPFLTGALFVLPMILCGFFLSRVTPPDQEDIKSRTSRVPINKTQRRELVSYVFPGIVLLTMTYMLLTAFRDLRDNFMAEIWSALGQGQNAAIFTETEIPVTLIVLIILGAMVFIRSNKIAFIGLHWLILGGLALTGLSSLAFLYGFLKPVYWMILTGVGLYVSYIPFNGMLFDRLIGAIQFKSTAGFLVYIADAFGYLASTGLLLYKNFVASDISWIDFFLWGCIYSSAVGFVLILMAMKYFKIKLNGNQFKTAGNTIV